MEENQFQTEAETYSLEAEVPTYVDNSEATSELQDVIEKK